MAELHLHLHMLMLLHFISQVYIGEIATPKVRGLLGSANQLCITIGVLAIFELGKSTNCSYW